MISAIIAIHTIKSANIAMNVAPPTLRTITANATKINKIIANTVNVIIVSSPFYSHIRACILRENKREESLLTPRLITKILLP